MKVLKSQVILMTLTTMYLTDTKPIITTRKLDELFMITNPKKTNQKKKNMKKLKFR